MNHTSGLVRYEFKDQFTKDLTANPEKVWKPAELIAYLLDEKPPFAAGKGWDYSDTNYIVLGMIIEKVTGKRFYDEANRRMLKPLKLNGHHSAGRTATEGRGPGLCRTKQSIRRQDAMIHDGKFAINPQFEWTGGGYASTAEDLARWAKMMYEGKAFSSDLMPQVLDGVPAPMLGPETKIRPGSDYSKDQTRHHVWAQRFLPGLHDGHDVFPGSESGGGSAGEHERGADLGKPLGRVVVEAMEVIKANAKCECDSPDSGH